jgi:hypothetical protein
MKIEIAERTVIKWNLLKYMAVTFFAIAVGVQI